MIPHIALLVIMAPLRDEAFESDAQALGDDLLRLEIEARLLEAHVNRELECLAPPSRIRLALEGAERLSQESARLRWESGRLVDAAGEALERRRGELARSLRAARQRRDRPPERPKQ